MMNSIEHLLLCLSIAYLAGCQTPKVSSEIPQSSWAQKYDIDAAKERRENEICQTLPKAWVFEISESGRVLANEQLQKDIWANLTLAEFNSLTDREANLYTEADEVSFAEELLWKASENIRRDPKNRELAYCHNSTGLKCADHLGELLLQGLAQGRMPYLVRSARQNPETGGYGVKECESGVIVSHQSLGRTSSEPENNPLIVFLKRPPRDVFIYTSVAE